MLENLFLHVLNMSFSGKDMEMSCDESVIRHLEAVQKEIKEEIAQGKFLYIISN